MKKLCLVIGFVFVTHSAFAQEPPRVNSSSSSANRSMVEMLYRMEQLQKELRQLRGDMEVVNHELTGIKKRQRELYLDIDRRLSDLEAGGVRKETPAVMGESLGQEQVPDVNTSNPVAVQEPVVAQPPSREEKDSYRSAFNLLKEGRYDQSIRSFSDFLSKYPASTYADNAQYWLGEANYVSRKYSAAVNEFNKVISSFPNSSKVPDAMLKLGFTHYELKEWNKARDILSTVVQKYPDSSAAKLAETRLQRLKSEGH